LEKINFQNDLVILLSGTLASGKTTFTQKIVEYLNLNDKASSPTFSIQQIYDNKVFHYDIYNKSLQEFISMGFLEDIDNGGIHIIEWATEELKDILIDYGFNVVSIEIKINGDKRIYEVKNV
jgi:tRNA threonylcarbamoyladenosine biosynthesis protein TsaE